MKSVSTITPYDFRRTHITSLLNSGAALQDVQAQAGHAGGATTMLYAQPAARNSRLNSAKNSIDPCTANP